MKLRDKSGSLRWSSTESIFGPILMRGIIVKAGITTMVFEQAASFLARTGVGGDAEAEGGTVFPSKPCDRAPSSGLDLVMMGL
jgi:hypothetical protein